MSTLFASLAVFSCVGGTKILSKTQNAAEAENIHLRGVYISI